MRLLCAAAVFIVLEGKAGGVIMGEEAQVIFDDFFEKLGA